MGSRPSALTPSSTMSDSESVANKENTGIDANTEEQNLLIATDSVKMETTETTVDSKKKPTFEKFVHMKLRAKRITEVSIRAELKLLSSSISILYAYLISDNMSLT
jgi:hypothetical protein